MERNITAQEKLKEVIHTIMAKRSLLPDTDGTTYCNFGIIWIIAELFPGNTELHNSQAGRPMLANEMYDRLNATCQKVAIADLDLTGGKVYLACSKGTEHGHIAIVYPTATRTFSFKWAKSVPLVANIGKENGIMGLNYAFGSMPDIFYFGEVFK